MTVLTKRIALITALSLLLLLFSGCDTSGDGIASLSWEEYDTLISNARAETDATVREAYLHEAEDMLMDTGCISPLYYQSDIYLMSEGVTGVYSSSIGSKYFMYANVSGADTLNAAFCGSVSSIDPAFATTIAEMSLVVNLFAGLYTYDSDGNLTPQLAQFTDVSDDGLVYTFTIKEGLLWSDGTSLGASDIAYSWRRLADSSTGSEYAYLLDVIALDEDDDLMIEADETDLILTVTLSSPCSYFLELCAFPALYAVKQSEIEYADGYTDYYGNVIDIDAWTLGTGFAVSGAYSVSSNTDGTYALTKNENFIDAENVTLSSLSITVSSDSESLYSLYQAGDIAFLGSVASELLEEDDGSENIDDENESLSQTGVAEGEIYRDELQSVYFLALNFNSDIYNGMTAEDAKLLRQAILLYIDRELIVNELTGEDEEIATSLIPSMTSDGSEGIYKKNDSRYTYSDTTSRGYYSTSTEENREKAREIIASLGLDEDGDGVLDSSITLTYLTVKSSLNIEIAQSIQQDLSMLGIIVQVSAVDKTVYDFEQSIFNYDIIAAEAFACYDDALTFLERWITDAPLNYTGLGSEIVEEDENAY